jgi:hypothetical protein
MPVAAGVLAVAYAALTVLQAPDPDGGARSRERVLAALSAPTAAPTPQPVPRAGLLGPSVLAPRPPRATLPPLLTLSADVAAAVPIGARDAQREIRFTISESSRPVVYSLADGRMFVIQQNAPDRGRPVMVTYGLEDATVRGQAAELYTSNVGLIRALVWWKEGGATYYLYSTTVTLRELVRIAEQLR